MATDVVVNKWNSVAVKNGLDDATKEALMKNYKLVESHHLFDGRLLLCTVSSIIAGIGIAWDYLYPHPQSRSVLIFCVISYFILSGIITLYVLFVEQNIFFVGKKMDPTGLDPPDVWQYEPTYHLSLVITDGKTSHKKYASLDRCVADFYDFKGQLRNDLYGPVLTKLIQEMDSGKKKK